MGSCPPTLGNTGWEGTVNPIDDFSSRFSALTGNAPFPWQEALFGQFRRADSQVLWLPTGLREDLHHRDLAAGLRIHARRGTVARLSSPPGLCRQPQDCRRSGDPRGRSCCESVGREPGIAQVAEAGRCRSLSTSRPAAAGRSARLRGPVRRQRRVAERSVPASSGRRHRRHDRQPPALRGYGVGSSTARCTPGFSARTSDGSRRGPSGARFPDAADLRSKRSSERCKEYRRGLRVMALTATSRAGVRATACQLHRRRPQHPKSSGRRMQRREGAGFVPVDDEKETGGASPDAHLRHKDSGSAIRLPPRAGGRGEGGRQDAPPAKPSRCRCSRAPARSRARTRSRGATPVFARFRPKPKVTPPRGPSYSDLHVGRRGGRRHLGRPHGLRPDAVRQHGAAIRPGEPVRRQSGPDRRCVLQAGGSGVTCGRVSTRAVNPIWRRTRALQVTRSSAAADRRREPPTPTMNARAGRCFSCGSFPNARIQAPRRQSSSPSGSTKEKRAELPSRRPRHLAATDILFDAWAMTRSATGLPGRPPVEPTCTASPKTGITRNASRLASGSWAEECRDSGRTKRPWGPSR